MGIMENKMKLLFRVLGLVISIPEFPAGFLIILIVSAQELDNSPASPLRFRESNVTP